jgi:hypothetical protein
MRLARLGVLMTEIAPLRGRNGSVIPSEGAAPTSERSPSPRYAVRGASENDLWGYAPTEPRIAEWTAPTGVVCWWDANGIFVHPKEKGVTSVRLVAPSVILRTLPRETRDVINRRRKKYLERTRKVRAV